MQVLGIFPVASYNGGSRNVTKLYNVIKKIICPCLWKATDTGAIPVAIPKYNNENRGYVEKYQSILSVFD